MQKKYRSLSIATAVLLVAMLSACASRKPAPSSSTQAVVPSSSQAAADSAAAEANAGVTTVRRSRFAGILSPYRPVIQQGNFVTSEMVAQLQPGMTREQVRFVLGTPQLADIFHGNRWDYPFRLLKRNGELTTSHVVIHFNNDVLARVDGGKDLPNEEGYLSRLSGGVNEARSNANEREERSSTQQSAGEPAAAPE